MLSRRDKLLVQPWEERRYKDHRSKVASAVAAVDASPPAARAHVRVNASAARRERERAARVRDDNFRLLRRLAALLWRSRVDHRWDPTPPSFQHKVGLFQDADELKARLTLRSLHEDASEAPCRSVRCYACDMNKRIYEYKSMGSGSRGESLPSIS